MNHYGKNMDTLSMDEKRLLVMDTLMVQIMEDMSKSSDVDMLKLMTCQQLVSERTKLVSKLLNIELNNEDEDFEIIEESDYSFQKYLKDRRENESHVSQTLRQVMWN